MARILTGGVGKTEVADTLRALALDGLEVTVSSDLEAASRLRAGQADYFLGTCLTGAGASLGVLVALMGSSACHTFGRRVPSPEQVAALLAEGRRVFGYSTDQIDAVTPVLARAIAAHRP
jgi:Protein of unknown function DUF2620